MTLPQVAAAPRRSRPRVADARKLRELIFKFAAVYEEPSVPAAVRNAELDASIQRALDRFEDREQGALSQHNDVIDADIVGPDTSG